MVAALPGKIQLKLDQTLAQWRQWACDPPLAGVPKLVATLGAGLSNFSILVEADSRFVVRIDGIDPVVHKLNRHGEWRSLEAAHGAGLAPAPRYFNPALGSLVCDYLTPDGEQPLNIPDIAQLLRGIHQLPARHHRLDLAERLLSYEKRLIHRNPASRALLEDYRLPVAEALSAAGQTRQPQVLCHHDLLRANRLYSGGRLFALDWEYSAMGSAWYELAVVAAGDELTPAETDTLLRAYLGSAASESQLRLVMQYTCVYRYLELLWYLAQDHPGLDDRKLEFKRELLDKNLRELDA